MLYEFRFGDAKTLLEELLSAAGNISLDKLLSGLSYRDYDTFDVELMTFDLAAQNQKALKQLRMLEEYKEPFINAFVTNDNDFYATNLHTLRCIQSAVKGIRDICRKFCPRVPRGQRHFLLNGVPLPSLYRKSRLTDPCCMKDLFGLESYPSCVSGLFTELMRFRSCLHDSVVLCLDIIRSVEAARLDAPRCEWMLQKFRREVLGDVREILKLVDPDALWEKLTSGARIIAGLRSHAQQDMAFAPQAYHNYRADDMKGYLRYEACVQIHRMGITSQEAALWGQDLVRIMRIRLVIAQFDRLLPADYKRRSLPSRQIALLMQWCGITQEKQYSTFIAYFNESYGRARSEGKATHDTITYDAVIKAKNKGLRDPQWGAYYAAFATTIEQLLAEETENEPAPPEGSIFGDDLTLPPDIQNPSVTPIE